MNTSEDGKPKIAMITGAGSGVGRICALAMLREGWSVVLVGRRESALEQTKAMARDADELAEERVLVVAADVSDADSVRALFAETKRRFGRLDFLFNNAGISAPGVPLEEITVEQWKQVVDINLTGAFLCTQEAFRLMKSQTPGGGRIVNNGSISAHVPRPNSAPYTATKHAISGLTRSTSLDGRRYDIACGQIDIGNALTEMATPMTKGVPQANGEIAIEPVMEPERVADALLCMARMPLDANIQTLTVMATKMPFIGRG
ncbi:MAG: SDR family oxidoreductase [Ectothiorhodospiraceae bacterium AqS1]|uniref:SDR family oxidoreductase n=1 Tax=Candidatus Amphirhobacter heronislandensis TaxID=1732024 RepID=A0A930UFB1_9GAMM|nr:SDR family oxidoreductase [Betaproteobacteria bacterium AqS2]MBF2760839.1 SDR family oxidoreductase [Ectothiorhodospiraceae bacterium AqS1]|eukprot:XP_011407094.1 PREDICTED: uncharacterized protein LOC105314549 [Amphimedon queenslandica]